MMLMNDRMKTFLILKAVRFFYVDAVIGEYNSDDIENIKQLAEQMIAEKLISEFRVTTEEVINAIIREREGMNDE